jgi:hypothetical protein
MKNKVMVIMRKANKDENGNLKKREEFRKDELERLSMCQFPSQ